MQEKLFSPQGYTAILSDISVTFGPSRRDKGHLVAVFYYRSGWLRAGERVSELSDEFSDTNDSEKPSLCYITCKHRRLARSAYISIAQAANALPAAVNLAQI